MDDLKSGDLEENTPSQNNEVIQLFPTPVSICRYEYNYDKELEFILNQDWKHIGGLEQSNKLSKDSFILYNSELKNIREFIEDRIKQYVYDFLGSDTELVTTQSWVNKNGKNEQHHTHHHPNSIVSGVWYPQVNENSSPIVFYSTENRDVQLSIREYNSFNGSSISFQMKKGELILFPSHLRHSVPPNPSNEDRISLSFNTWPRGNLGDIDKLTYIPLCEMHITE